MRFLFRVDSSITIGTGHVVRCLNLAQKLRFLGHTCEFSCRLHSGNIVHVIKSRGFYVHTLDATAIAEPPTKPFDEVSHQTWLGVSQNADATELISKVGISLYDWVIVDHYGIDSMWETQIRPICQRLMVIDDLANRFHICDLLLDQSLVDDYFNRYDSLIPDTCARLLGPKYALLHPDFQSCLSTQYRHTNTVPRVLVSFGGNDVGGVTLFVVKALLEVDDIDFYLDVVVSREAESYSSLVAISDSSKKLTIHSALPSLAGLMFSCDKAIGATGITTWERLCAALPTLVITVADNQVKIAEHLNKIGLVEYIGPYTTLDKDVLIREFRRFVVTPMASDFATICHGFVSGNGADVIGTLLSADVSCTLNARCAVESDLYQLYEWTNDPFVRKNSLNSQTVSYESHHEWFTMKLRSLDTSIYIVELESAVGVGVVRFERQGNHSILNYSIAPSLRGRGLAKRMLTVAIACHRQVVGSFLIEATVKLNNNASRKVLENLPFVEVQCDSELVRYKMIVE